MISKMNLKYLLIIITLIINIDLYSQFVLQWAQRYNSPSNGSDIPVGIAVDDSGNVIVTGESEGNYTTIKYGSNGVLRWLKSYNGGGFDDVNGISTDKLCNIYITGTSNNDIVTIKYKPNGDTSWIRKYGFFPSAGDQGNSIIVDDSSNVYVTGRSEGPGTSGDAVLIKYNTDGDSIWIRRFDNSNHTDDSAIKVKLDIYGNVYLIGYSIINNNKDFLTIKFDRNGNLQWYKLYNGTGNYDDIARDLAISLDRSVYVTGASWGGTIRNDYATIKFDSLGNQTWVQRYNGTGNEEDISVGVIVDNTGKCVITGYSWSTSNGYDVVSIKYDTTGQIVWQKRYDNSETEYAVKLLADRFDNYYVIGTFGVNNQDFNYYTIKYSSAGNILWSLSYNGPSNSQDASTDAVIDTSLNLYITGYSNGASNTQDFATVKYSQLTGIQETGNSIANSFLLHQNYPNPFNPTTVISFSIPKSSPVSIKIYNAIGAEIEIIVNKELNRGNYEITWDASKYSSGVYYFRIEAGEFKSTKKMVLVK